MQFCYIDNSIQITRNIKAIKPGIFVIWLLVVTADFFFYFFDD